MAHCIQRWKEEWTDSRSFRQRAGERERGIDRVIDTELKTEIDRARENYTCVCIHIYICIYIAGEIDNGDTDRDRERDREI